MVVVGLRIFKPVLVSFFLFSFFLLFFFFFSFLLLSLRFHGLLHNSWCTALLSYLFFTALQGQLMASVLPLIHPHVVYI